MLRDSTIFFFGTSQFAVPILEALIQSEWRPCVVITAPDHPAGRGLKPKPSPVKQKALEHGLKIWEPARLADRIAALAPDLFILAAYGKIIPHTLLAIPKAGSLNVHPSLLPRWRGPAPIQYAILNGDPVTGVTIMIMDEEVDHGPILAQSPVTITLTDTGETLEKKLSVEGARLLLERLPVWLQGGAIPQPQDHAQATYTHLLTKEDGIIDWSLSAVDIARRIRAFIPWPGSHTFWNKNGCLRITIMRAAPYSPLKTAKIKTAENQKPGSAFSRENRLFIAAGEGALEILELQLEGRRPVSGKEFLNGHRAIIGTQLASAAIRD